MRKTICRQFICILADVRSFDHRMHSSRFTGPPLRISGNGATTGPAFMERIGADLITLRTHPVRISAAVPLVLQLFLLPEFVFLKQSTGDFSTRVVHQQLHLRHGQYIPRPCSGYLISGHKPSDPVITLQRGSQMCLLSRRVCSQEAGTHLSHHSCRRR